MEIYEHIRHAREKRIECALCVIVNTHGSTPRSAGSKMLVFKDGQIIGSIGGGALEKKVIDQAISSLRSGKPALHRHDLLHQHNMCCGGSVDIYIEPLMNKQRLYIFGAGHTGQALARHARHLEFDVFIIDDRKEYLDQIRFEGVSKLNLAHTEALQVLPFDESTFSAIMTYSHPIDREILSFCLKKPGAYIGMIGSDRKVEMTKKMFAQAGVATLEELERVDMPMGVDIAAETPDEIAISILARLIRVRRTVAAA